ncbi:unnamed protein product [Amoebophrya sp. A25]|nr:unnamed protein product [Amoebophrya sp. A25]|eukprot:GSA25T00023451001.1
MKTSTSTNAAGDEPTPSSSSSKRPFAPPATNGSANGNGVEDDTALSRRNKRQKRECPYLSTVNRNVLDFDFERVCSVTLSDQNIYACLVCGKFFQGRGRGTTAYQHALEQQHYVFVNLESTQAYCLPEDYEITDASLNDVKYNLKPNYTQEQVLKIARGEAGTYHAKSLDGVDFIPGCIGLNIIKNSDYLNVVLQLMCAIIPLRNFLLLYEPPQKPDQLVKSLADLIKKQYNPKNFKGLASPHEVFQAIGRASNKKFYGAQHDPVALISWLYQYLRKKLKNQLPIADILEGQILVKVAKLEGDRKWTDSVHPSVVVQLDLPDAPLFKDDFQIPQVNLFSLLEKYNGEKAHESIAKSGEARQIRKFSLRKLPPYLIFQIKRFKHNGYFVEKNPTIVNFPLKDLDLRNYLQPAAVALNPETRYNLVASVTHEGKPKGGAYKIHVSHKALEKWHEIQDLRVTEVLPQAVALAEAYMLIYQRLDVEDDGTYGNFSAEQLTAAQDAADGAAMGKDEHLDDCVDDMEAMGIQIS